MNLWGHIKTTTEHRIEVMKNCFRIGLYWQGLTHDLSKYSPTEFIQGIKYYQGDKSPNVAERADTGMSKAWMHHKGRNRHHYEYWTDYKIDGVKGQMYGMDMPRKYVAEMVCDRIAASKIYNGANYSDAYPLAYLLNGIDGIMMSDRTKNDLTYMLDMLKVKGEEVTFKYIRNEYLKGCEVPVIDIGKVKEENVIPEKMSR